MTLLCATAGLLLALVPPIHGGHDGAPSESDRIRARHAESAGDDALAIELYQRHLLRDGSDVESRLLLARLLSRQDERAAAEDHLRRCLEQAPEDPTVHLAFGLLLHRWVRFDEARHHLGRALALRPGDAGLRFFLGTLEAHAGRLRAARAYFQNAVELRPDWALPTVELARLRSREGAPAEALVELWLARRSVDDPVIVDAAVAEIWAGLGRGESAVACWRRVLETGQVDHRALRVEAFEQMGRHFRERGLVEAAIACFESCILQSDRAQSCMTDLAPLYAQVGRAADGIALFELTLTVAATTPERVAFASLLESSGRTERALDVLEEAFDDGARTVPLLWNLSRLAEDRQRPRRARQAFESLEVRAEQFPEDARPAAWSWALTERRLHSRLEGIADPSRARRDVRRVRERVEAEGEHSLQRLATRLVVSATDVSALWQSAPASKLGGG